MNLTVEERFWDKVAFIGATDEECWQWKSTRFADGYGSFWLDGKNRRAHVAMYEIFVGEKLPQGWETDHICRNRSCLNPSHLRLVPHGVNASRWAREKTHCPKGHEYSPENTRVRSLMRKGRVVYCRSCKTCDLLASRAQWQRKKKHA